MSKSLYLGITIGAALQASVGKAFGGVKKDLDQLGKSIRSMRNSRGLVDRFHADKQAARKTEQELRKTQAEIQQLAAELKKSPSKKLEQSLESAKNHARRLKQTLARQREELERTRRAMRETGQSVGDLVRDYQRMGRAIEEAKRRQVVLGEVLAKQQRNKERRAELRGKMLGVLGAAYAVGNPLRQSMRFEHQLRLFGNTAGFTNRQLAETKTRLNALAQATNQTPGALLSALDFLVGKGVDPTVALKSLQSIGRAATATGADITDLAKTAFAALDSMKVPADQIGAVMDTLAQSGKMGGFELRDMARWFPMLTAQAKALGMEGRQGLATLGAALQVAIKGAGSPDEAANNFNNFLAKLTAPETVKHFEKAGVDIQQVFADALSQGKNPVVEMLYQIQEITGGDKFAIGKLFGDMQVINFLNPMLANLKEFERIRNQSLDAQGVIAGDFGNMAATAQEQWKQLGISLGRVGDALAASILPGVNKVVGTVVWLGDKLYALTQQFPTLTSLASGAVAGLTAFRVAALAGGYALTIVSDGWQTLRRVASFGWFGKLVEWSRKGASVLLTLGRVALPVVATGLRVLGAALVANPVGAVVAGISLAAGLVIANWGKVKQFFLTIWDKVKPVWEKFAGWVLNLWDKISAPFKAVGGLLGEAWNATKGAVGKAWAATTAWLSGNETTAGKPGKLAKAGALAATVAAAPAVAAPSAPVTIPEPVVRTPQVGAVTLPEPSPLGAHIPASEPSAQTRQTVVNHTDNSTITITVHQQPGEDAEALARRVAEYLREQRRVERTGALYDLEDG